MVSFRSRQPVILSEVPGLLDILGLEASGTVEYWQRRRTNWLSVPLNFTYYLGFETMILLRREGVVDYCPDHPRFTDLLHRLWFSLDAPNPEDVLDDVIIYLD